MFLTTVTDTGVVPNVVVFCFSSFSSCTTFTTTTISSSTASTSDFTSLPTPPAPKRRCWDLPARNQNWTNYTLLGSPRTSVAATWLTHGWGPQTIMHYGFWNYIFSRFIFICTYFKINQISIYIYILFGWLQLHIPCEFGGNSNSWLMIEINQFGCPNDHCSVFWFTKKTLFNHHICCSWETLLEYQDAMGYHLRYLVRLNPGDITFDEWMTRSYLE